MNDYKHFPPSWSNVYKDYKVLKVLGIGGMAIVYLVETLDKNKYHFALKYRKQDNNNDNLLRFRNELFLHKKINSKNFPYIVDEYINAFNEQYFVMEYIEGKTLKEIIKENRFIETRIAIMYARQIANGISKIHNLGIIHRDIKSENIMITNDQKIKIIDLGISFDTSKSVNNVPNSVCTSYYNAPETIENSNNISNAVDIYSLGILIYEMLTGKYPFKGSTPIETILMHKRYRMPSLRNIKGVSETLEMIINKATAKNPNDRYCCIFDFNKDLETYLKIEYLSKNLPSQRKSKNSKIMLYFLWYSISIMFLIIVVILLSMINK
ncbi:serine/threonine-protein kinase [Mycoplasma crocodyli]|uniref:Serine/threonine-protein kinase n=1 Tax=Mycoplasma crocodyli (strain ATCC 51981 / MP145) TaxID=512564 RepID=D5E592_MYCCM|nr:serine/threonine-protein kinase [Mycoplasma crocodyli]ADE20026.1 serine/threonine-protein kinase [Mycoplasma crocodyli MP145]